MNPILAHQTPATIRAMIKYLGFPMRMVGPIPTLTILAQAGSLLHPAKSQADGSGLENLAFPDEPFYQS
jgi:hypothetical protein